MELEKLLSKQPKEILDLFDNPKQINENFCIGLLQIHTDNPILNYLDRSNNIRKEYTWNNNKWEENEYV